MKKSFYKSISKKYVLASDEDINLADRLCFSLAMNRILGGSDTNRYFEDSCGHNGWIFFEDEVCQHLYEQWKQKVDQSPKDELKSFELLLSQENRELIRSKIAKSKQCPFGNCKDRSQTQNLINRIPEWVLQFLTDDEITQIATLIIDTFNTGFDGYTYLLNLNEPWEEVLKEIPKTIQDAIPRNINSIVTAVLYAYMDGIYASVDRFLNSVKKAEVDQEDKDHISYKALKLKKEIEVFLDKLEKFDELS